MSVVLPDGLTSIGDRAFYNCSKMTGSIVIPQSVSYLGSNAFNGTAVESLTFEKGVKLLKFTADCLPSRLKSLTIPASIMAIQTTDFGNLTALENLSFEEGANITEIPSSVESIGDGAFSRCSSLVSLSFESGSALEVIGGEISGYGEYYGAFSDCTNLRKVLIPMSVTEVYGAAFSGCSSLYDVSFEENSKCTTILGDSYYKIGPFSYTAVESLTLPKSMSRISSYGLAMPRLVSVTFEGTGTVCVESNAFTSKRLTQIDASNGGIEVEENAFAYGSIKLVKIGAIRPPSCAPSGFENASYATLMVPEDSIEEYSTAPGWKEFGTVTKL